MTKQQGSGQKNKASNELKDKAGELKDKANELKDKSSELKDKLVAGYEHMLERCRKQMEHIEGKATPALQELVASAKAKSVELGELTEEEAQKVANYLQRDLEDAGSFLADAKESLSAWLSFDLKLMESSLWKGFASLADKTSLEVMKLKQRLTGAGGYNSGEVTSLGSLQCSGCGKVVNFEKVARIPPCPKCHNTHFIRARETAAANKTKDS